MRPSGEDIITITVSYWRCLREGLGLLLYLFVSGHDQARSYKIEAALHLKGTPLGLILTTHSLLTESPASVEIQIPTEGLEPGLYDVAISFDGEHVGTFPCEVGEQAPA